MLLDTSILVELFRSPRGSERHGAILREIDDEELFISIVQLAEVSDWALRNGRSAEERVAWVKSFARIVPLEEETCILASEIKQQRRKLGHANFGILDGLVLAAARGIGQRLLTFDGDFKGESDCVVLS